MNIILHGPAWEVDLQAEQPVIGDGCPFREQRLHIRSARGWTLSDFSLSRYGDFTLTWRHDDSNQTAELNLRPDDDHGRHLASGLVWMVARLGDAHYGNDADRRASRARASELLDRLEGAITGARAALAESLESPKAPALPTLPARNGAEVSQ